MGARETTVETWLALVMHVSLPRIALGAASGAVATVPMSLVMLGAQRLGMLPVLPPEEITDDAMARAGVAIDEDSSNVLATISHLAYGAGAGAAYRSLIPTRAQGAGSGVGFALALYTGSYLGWLPALGLKPAGQGRANMRSAAMVVAHIVFGAVLGGISRSRRR
jgi:hypothetical protein